MKIYIIDYIGVHCGMHYYLDSFKKLLDSDTSKVTILSNYSDNECTFLKHQYKGNIIQKIISLLINITRVSRFIRKHPDDLFIYLTYGNIIDIPFMYLISKRKYHMIDIHEAIAQHIDHKYWLKELFAHIYSKKIHNVITHSQRTNDFLDEWKYSRHRLYVPHFKYQFAKTYIKNNLGEDVLNVIQKEKINILFFGNITHAKGIDILLSSLNSLDNHQISALNVIIAGKDADGSYSTIDLKYPDKVHFILRHINDDELIFLYKNIDFVAMPYRKTSQSGILEMAFYFKKPIIASRIPYFEKMLREFTSFGILSEGNNVETYTESIIKSLKINYNNFFNDKEYSIYENRREIENFKMKFNEIINIYNEGN